MSISNIVVKRINWRERRVMTNDECQTRIWLIGLQHAEMAKVPKKLLLYKGNHRVLPPKEQAKLISRRLSISWSFRWTDRFASRGKRKNV